MRQTGRSSRIINFIVDQLFSNGEVICTDHTAYEYADKVTRDDLLMFINKVHLHVEMRSAGKYIIDHNFVNNESQVKLIHFKLKSRK